MYGQYVLLAVASVAIFGLLLGFAFIGDVVLPMVPLGAGANIPSYMNIGGSQYPEICNNLVDDDGDGRIDCKDADCTNDLYCIGGCRIDKYNSKRAGSKICKEGQLFVCKKISTGFDWVLTPCPKDKKCINGKCR